MNFFPGTFYITDAKHLSKYLMECKQEINYLQSRTYTRVHITYKNTEKKIEKMKIKLYFTYLNKIPSSFNSIIRPISKSIIYQIECNCKVLYNGETKVGPSKRIKRHENNILKTTNNCNCEVIQRLTQNCNKYKFHIKDAFVTDNEIDLNKRTIKEFIYSVIIDSSNKYDQIDEN